MRLLTIIFGLLDFWAFAAGAVRSPIWVRNLADQTWWWVGCLLITASLAASSYGLLRGRQWAFYLNYAQFPVRILLGFLSFAFVAWMILPRNPSWPLNTAVWGSAIVLECVRLALTIKGHVGLRRAAMIEKGLCPNCGYDLRATPTRCPECGAESSAGTENKSHVD